MPATGTGTKRSIQAAGQLRDLLAAGAAREDLDAYDPQMIDEAAGNALEAVRRHVKGQPIVKVDADSGIRRAERPVTVATIVNDNMPFLFDSVMGEITERGLEPLFVTHPVIRVIHGAGGVTSIEGEIHGPRRDPDKLSVIHVHLPALTAEDAEALRLAIAGVLDKVAAAVRDWKPMLARLEQVISDYRYLPLPMKPDAVAEAVAFMEWLRDDNFTFLGMREYRYTGSSKTGTLKRTDKAGLGILSDPNLLVLRGSTESATTTPEIRAFLHGPEPLIVTKANAKSVVHRRSYLDYVGIKTFDPKGKLTGELRVVGLFTSTAYTRSVQRIPYLRSKAEAVLAKSGFDRADHSGKALINVLESYPRDELFQIETPLLRKHAMSVLALGERPRVRALVRVDQFDRFVSVIVFVPRDRYDSRVRERIGEYLRNAFKGRLSAYYPTFPEGTLARVHFIIGRSEGRTPKVSADEIEARIRDIVRTWDDALRQAVAENGAAPELAAIAARFPEAYRGSFSPDQAIEDAATLSAIAADNPIAIDFYRPAGEPAARAALKIHHHGEPVALSRRVPLLENMGFKVISERTFAIHQGDVGTVYLHDMRLENAFGEPVALDDGGRLLEDVFLSAWRGAGDNDSYNALVQTAGLASAQITILRAYGRYLQQVGIPQSQEFVASVLNRHPGIARDLHALFEARFDPAMEASERARSEEKLVESIETALENVPVLDDDVILRRYRNLVMSTLRTNLHLPERTARGLSLAFKLDPHAVEGLPEPRPWREIFVYGPEVEGVHLRFGPVARGGLRWSDRAQDYRTEVLGLVKAQQVKNAVIVPVGAKGGFYPRKLPTGGSRDQIFEAGRQAYVNFVSTMLSITDNLDVETVVPPEGIVRHDGDDPYFVVAADKGTATFSDTANAISQGHGFWLDDAFASGGSAGYDHKKMGITARGAWEAVKRHFREMNRDIQNEPFTAAGVGDMSGDVFGNGMLLSRQTRLVAAFDHRDIFIDPDPDPAVSFEERARVFALPRSSWQDYDRSKLSKGGGVFPRSQKSVSLSQEAAAAIGLDRTSASPRDIMNAILRMEVDLFWFGGIGTYVRAESESNAEVGDRANDAIRVTAAELGAKVVGEGANLGMTQKARIEYGLHGGRCNSDAIDNSAGVNSSDVEVNIKIALASAMRKGSLTRKARDKLLAAMTDEVAELVLANNYKQTLAISLEHRKGLGSLAELQRLMAALEGRGLLDRAIETLPSDAAIQERNARGEPLTRAEIGVLLSYSKLVLFDDLLRSALPDDPYFESNLASYFPAGMNRKFREEIATHRLRREIVATLLGNDAINRGGPGFINTLQEMTGCLAHEAVEAYAVIRDGFELPAVLSAIDALDTRIDGQSQLDLYMACVRFVRAGSAWILKNGASGTVSEQIGRIAAARKVLEPVLASLLPTFMKQRLDDRRDAFRTMGAPDKLAERLALLAIGEIIPDIDLVAAKTGADPKAAAKVHLEITEAFRLGRIFDAAASMQPADFYDGLALSRATDMIASARRGIAVEALSTHGEADDPAAAWLMAGGARIERVREGLRTLTESSELTVSRLTVAAGLMADLTAG